MWPEDGKQQVIIITFSSGSLAHTEHSIKEKRIKVEQVEYKN